MAQYKDYAERFWKEAYKSTDEARRVKRSRDDLEAAAKSLFPAKIGREPEDGRFSLAASVAVHNRLFPLMQTFRELGHVHGSPFSDRMNLKAGFEIQFRLPDSIDWVYLRLYVRPGHAYNRLVFGVSVHYQNADVMLAEEPESDDNVTCDTVELNPMTTTVAFIETTLIDGFRETIARAAIVAGPQAIGDIQNLRADNL